MFRRDDVDAMGERMTAQLGIDQRSDDARAGEAEPYRQIFGPVRHHQADRFVLGQPLIERPTRETVGACDERPIGQALAAARRYQRRRIALRLGEFRDHVVEQALWTGGDRRRAFKRTDQVAQRAVVRSHRRPRRFRFGRLHQIVFAELNESFAAAALWLSERALSACLKRVPRKAERLPLTLLSGCPPRSLCPLFTPRKSNDIQIEHDPEKWTPAFPKRSRSTKKR